MMGQTGFIVLVALIWASATAFGGLIVYWFLVEGFAEEGITEGGQFAPEDRSYTHRSLMIWAGFFAIILLLIAIW